jgi:hypothetical protein
LTRAAGGLLRHEIRSGHPNTFLQFKGGTRSPVVGLQEETVQLYGGIARLSLRIARLERRGT